MEKKCLDYDKAIIYGQYKWIAKEDNYLYENENENYGVIKKAKKNSKLDMINKQTLMI